MEKLGLEHYSGRNYLPEIVAGILSELVGLESEIPKIENVGNDFLSRVHWKRLLENYPYMQKMVLWITEGCKRIQILSEDRYFRDSLNSDLIKYYEYWLSLSPNRSLGQGEFRLWNATDLISRIKARTEHLSTVIVMMIQKNQFYLETNDYLQSERAFSHPKPFLPKDLSLLYNLAFKENTDESICPL